MEPSEVTTLIDTFKSNAGAGILLLLYYLVLYGGRLIEGLGLNRNKGNRAGDIKTRLEVMQLKIELEQKKRESGLSAETLAAIEAETLEQLGPKSGHQFNNKQKFIAIPLLLLLVIMAVSEIRDTQTNGEDPFDTIIGFVFFAIVIVVGFWGIEHLQKVKSRRARAAGFIAYWTFGLFIALAVVAAILEMAFGWLLTSEDYGGIYLLLAFVISLILGLMKRLPGMRAAESVSD
ncbi:hypothetical protein IC617_06055 [Neiella sp. HB171785]|uniref:Uncharacterized protein n=1 Tax=Neiella litorisoli TaxID=2771431 RepID=A0A8J6QTN7_9GAMM|nr:hypothetical protein [Neiella litorisoli]MBD1388987.1 hypothetical protein [Neiella litorisoli]